MGVPRERIVLCPRSENFWQAGPRAPAAPARSSTWTAACEHGQPEDLPGEENERFLEYWNLVFMQYNQDPPNTLQELPARNIDTGLGLNRLAAILQEKRSVFETDQFWPLIELGQELSGARYGEDRRARPRAAHPRRPLARDDLPRRRRRRALQRRPRLRAASRHAPRDPPGARAQMAPGFLLRYAARVRELMARRLPRTRSSSARRSRCGSPPRRRASRARSSRGSRRCASTSTRRKADGQRSIRAEDAFRLHDTSGFPFDLTRELLAEEGLTVDEAGFERLMEEQRARARVAARRPAPTGGRRGRRRGSRAARSSWLERNGAATRFTGYETEEQATTVRGRRWPMRRPGTRRQRRERGLGRRLLIKLADSPFYAVGGGQVSDSGLIECEGGDCAGHASRTSCGSATTRRVEVVLERGELAPHQRVLARVDHAARHATECNHTATHLLHAALRARLGPHVRQAGSYVGPDKLRFDFTHTQRALARGARATSPTRSTPGSPRTTRSHPILTTREEAERLGAMALFGEKYGDVVRMVEIGDGDYSRELCGGTHVRSTSEIGVFHIVSESSSAANVRRIEALTGPAAVALLRERERRARGDRGASCARAPTERLEAVRKARGRAARAAEGRRARVQAAATGRRGGRAGARRARRGARRRWRRACS